MNDVILVMELDEDVDKYQLYEDLTFYEQQRIKVKCEYKGIDLSNENLNNNELNNFKIYLNDKEYCKFLKEYLKIQQIYKNAINKVKAPLNVKFMVEKAKVYMDNYMVIDKFEDECYYLYNKNRQYAKAINLVSYVYIASMKEDDDCNRILSIINNLKMDCNELDFAIARKLYDNVFNDLSFFDKTLEKNSEKKLVRI